MSFEDYSSGRGAEFDRFFEDFHQKTYRLSLSLARRYLKDIESAKDAVQSAYLNFYRFFDDFRGDAKPHVFFYRIVSNTCLDIIRKNSKSPKLYTMPDNMIGPSYNPTTLIELEMDVAKFIGTLSPDEKETVLLLRGEYSYREMSENLGIPSGTLKTRIHRIRNRKETAPYRKAA